MKVRLSSPTATAPTYATPGSAALDFYADMPGASRGVSRHDPLNVSLGVQVEVPPGHVLLLFSRSGHGFNNDVRLGNCVGVIDSDYRGVVFARLICDAPPASPRKRLIVKHGDRVAQGIVVPIPRVNVELVDELSPTERGEGGLGSTGA
ncbi:MAG: dUTP diphosphatase [Burkholderiales bacterium]|nr:dUTP diphosphatase [Burkholderiales bacterium]